MATNQQNRTVAVFGDAPSNWPPPPFC